MDTRLTALVIGLLLAGSSAAGAGQTKTVEQPPRPAGTVRARTQIPAQIQRMPNLVGQTFQAAQQDSRVVNLKLQLVPARRTTKDQRPGVIVDQEPAPGSTVRPGTQVTVYVAVSPPDDVARMPNLIGQLFDRAQQDSRVVGLKLRLVPREQPTGGQRAGIIIDQKPSPGDPVQPGASVVAVVAVAAPPERVEVPRVVTMQAKDGASLLARRTLNTQEQFTETARAEPGTIVDQKPSPGTLVPQNSTVMIVVARRPPQPPLPPEDTGPRPPPQPKLFPMPDLIGRVFSQAERDPAVTQLQLRLNPQLDFQAGGLPSTIVRQSVRPGDSVPIGQAVIVFIASGVAVPRVVQQQADAASERILAVGLNPRRTEETSELTPGTVLRQVPDPGVLVARGAAVGITVAVPPKVVIPNLVGRTRADAIQELTRLRLRANPADDEASSLPPELVVSQVPSAGTAVVVGGAVRITVATGVEVPNLSGLSADDAQRAVVERGLSFDDTAQETDAAPPGQVFQQQPASGARVTRGSRVLATVAVAVPVLVPSVVGLPRQRAAAVLEAAGLRAGPEPDATASGRVVERQQPAANTRVARLTPVTLFVAAPPPPPVQPQPGPAAPAGPATPAPAPLPGPVPTPPPAVQPTGAVVAVPELQPGDAQPGVAPPGGVQPGGVQPPAQSGGGAPAGPVAIPAQPLLPPWLLSLLVAVAAIAASTYRLWLPGSSPPPPPIQTTSPATPPPAIDVRPELGDATLRLEVSGRSLISMDVRVRVGHGGSEQVMSLEDGALVLEERRLYE